MAILDWSKVPKISINRDEAETIGLEAIKLENLNNHLANVARKYTPNLMSRACTCQSFSYGFGVNLNKDLEKPAGIFDNCFIAGNKSFAVFIEDLGFDLGYSCGKEKISNDITQTLNSYSNFSLGYKVGKLFLKLGFGQKTTSYKTFEKDIVDIHSEVSKSVIEQAKVALTLQGKSFPNAIIHKTINKFMYSTTVDKEFSEYCAGNVLKEIIDYYYNAKTPSCSEIIAFVNLYIERGLGIPFDIAGKPKPLTEDEDYIKFLEDFDAVIKNSYLYTSLFNEDKKDLSEAQKVIEEHFSSSTQQIYELWKAKVETKMKKETSTTTPIVATSEKEEGTITKTKNRYKKAVIPGSIRGTIKFSRDLLIKVLVDYTVSKEPKKALHAKLRAGTEIFLNSDMGKIIVTAAMAELVNGYGASVGLKQEIIEIISEVLREEAVSDGTQKILELGIDLVGMAKDMGKGVISELMKAQKELEAINEKEKATV